MVGKNLICSHHIEHAKTQNNTHCLAEALEPCVCSKRRTIYFGNSAISV